jgi:hypothetical protein
VQQAFSAVNLLDEPSFAAVLVVAERIVKLAGAVLMIGVAAIAGTIEKYPASFA